MGEFEEMRNYNWTPLPVLPHFTVESCMALEKQLGIAYPFDGDATTILNKKELA